MAIKWPSACILITRLIYNLNKLHGYQKSVINVTCGWSFEPLCLGLKLGRTFIQTSLEENFVLLYLWLEVGNYLSIVFVLSVFQDIWHLEWSANCLTIWSVSWRETYTEIYKHITLSSSTDQLDLRALKVVHLRSREIKDWFDDFKVLLMFFFFICWVSDLWTACNISISIQA